MKKNIGPVVALYPTPVVIVGTRFEGRVNWINIAHIGIIALDRIMLSIAKEHYSNVALIETKQCSVNIVSEEMVVEADYAGMVSEKDTDKSKLFAYTNGSSAEIPLIDLSPVSMECKVVDNYQTSHHNHFILQVVHTHVKKEALTPQGKIDYKVVKPVLFEMPTGTYLKTGETLGHCWNLGQKYTHRMGETIQEEEVEGAD